MRLGDRRRRRIGLQQPTSTDDGYGGKTKTWSTVDYVWAKRTTLRTTEALIAMQNTGRAIHSYLIRYRSDVDGSWRLLDGSTTMAIIGEPIDLRDEHKWLDIKAEEVT